MINLSLSVLLPYISLRINTLQVSKIFYSATGYQYGKNTEIGKR